MSDQFTRCAYRYTVKSGDSFYLIAQRQGVQLRDLLEANPTIPPARLTVGDVLCIPYAQGAEQPAAEQPENACDTPPCAEENQGGDSGGEQGTYVCPVNRRAVMQNGQTFGDLLVRYNLSYHTLKEANIGTDLDALKGGDLVCIPSVNLSCSVPTVVTLEEGDTLDSTASRYQVTAEQLLRSNPCLAPNDFKEGAVIRLPE